MYYPNINIDNNTRSVIDVFGGYNHNRRINSGEFYDMLNLSSDEYPLITPRNTRALLSESKTKIRSVLYTDNDLIYLAGNELIHPKKQLDLSAYFTDDSEQTMIRFGAFVLIFPALIWVNIVTMEHGSWTDKVVVPVGTEITFTIADLEGRSYQNIVQGNAAPINPSAGMYWLCTKPDAKGLNVWNDSKSMWDAVATCYIRIEIPGAELTKHFAEGENIFMNTPVADINEGSMIQKITDDYLVVIAFMDQIVMNRTSNKNWQMYIERKIPSMDYICADKNRIWGCKYGWQNGEMLNEIYASKLGDFKNFYAYTGIATDSYAVQIGKAGEWTGCVSYQGVPTFFKEDAIFRIFGSSPSQYQIAETDARGVQKGSAKSIAKVGEFLFYKSTSDVCIYDGAYPQAISKQLGRRELYYDAAAGACLDKYHLICRTALGKRRHFVWDHQYAMWHKEDAPAFFQFTASENGQIYAATENQIWGLGSRDNITYLSELPGEEYVEWMCESGELGLESPDAKYVDKIIIRAFLPSASEIQVAISVNDRQYDEVGVMRGQSDAASQSFEFHPFRCDHFKIKLKGHGAVRIYSIAIQREEGGDDEGYAYR